MPDPERTEPSNETWPEPLTNRLHGRSVRQWPESPSTRLGVPSDSVAADLPRLARELNAEADQWMGQLIALRTRRKTT